MKRFHGHHRERPVDSQPQSPELRVASGIAISRFSHDLSTSLVPAVTLFFGVVPFPRRLSPCGGKMAVNLARLTFQVPTQWDRAYIFLSFFFCHF
jgi:hypothetical protein